MDKIIQLFSILNNLRNIPRVGFPIFGGIDLKDVESVAEHSYKTIYISMVLADIAKTEGKNINSEHLLKHAILHDWPESILGDIPSSSPSYNSYFEENIKEIYKKAEAKVMKDLSKFLIEKTKKDYSDFVNNDSLENKIVQMADITSLLIEVIELKSKSYNLKWFGYLWANTIKRLENVGKNFKFTGELINALEDTYSKPKDTNPLLTKQEFQSKKD